MPSQTPHTLIGDRMGKRGSLIGPKPCREIGRYSLLNLVKYLSRDKTTVSHVKQEFSILITKEIIFAIRSQKHQNSTTSLKAHKVGILPCQLVASE